MAIVSNFSYIDKEMKHNNKQLYIKKICSNNLQNNYNRYKKKIQSVSFKK